MKVKHKLYIESNGTLQFYDEYQIGKTIIEKAALQHKGLYQNKDICGWLVDNGFKPKMGQRYILSDYEFRDFAKRFGLEISFSADKKVVLRDERNRS